MLPSRSTNKPRPTAAQLKRMANEYRRQARHFTACIDLLKYVNAEIYRRGRDIFTTDAALADWLSSPARALRGKVPLEVMSTAAGRKKVAEVLIALAHGAVL